MFNLVNPYDPYSYRTCLDLMDSQFIGAPFRNSADLYLLAMATHQPERKFLLSGWVFSRGSEGNPAWKRAEFTPFPLSRKVEKSCIVTCYNISGVDKVSEFANPHNCISSSIRILCVSPPFTAQSAPMHQRERAMGKSVRALKYLARTD